MPSTPSLKVATEKDVGSIVSLIHELYKTSVYEKHSDFNEDDVSETTMNILASDPRKACIMLLKDGEENVGVIVMSTMANLFNKAHLTAVELAFWIDYDYRTKTNLRLMMKMYRHWARLAGCQTLMMGKLKVFGEPETYSVRRLHA